MIDTIHLYHGVEPENEPEISENLLNEINQYNNPKGTTYYRKRHLLNGKVIVNYSERANRDMTTVSKNQFINISSLAYLLNQEANDVTPGPISLPRAFKNLEKLLKEEGIKFDVQNAKISRLDLTLNLNLPNPVHHYFPILRLLQPSGFEKHEHDGTNLTFHKSHENSIVLYDKLEQLRKRKNIPIAQSRAKIGLTNTEHMLRIEHQFRRARQVKKHLGVTTVAELLQNKHILSSKIKDEFRAMLTGIDTQQLNMAVKNIHERDILSSLIKGNESSYFHFGILRVCNENIEEALQLICHNKGINNQRFNHRTRKRLHAALQIHKTLAIAKDVDHYRKLLKAINKPVWQ